MRSSCRSGAGRYARRAVSAPAIDREALKARYDAIFATTVPPFAFVDLDALERNARRLLDQVGGLPIRIASKSVRSTAIPATTGTGRATQRTPIPPRPRNGWSPWTR